MYQVERIENGPACMDRSSEHYSGYAAERAERKLYDGFMGAVDNGDANALCDWAPYITDWSVARSIPIDQRTATSLPKRAQTLAEVMSESLDYARGPSMTEAMQLIINVATGCDESTRSQAMRLLERMADAYAKYNATEEA